jgi:hypothetical protein
MISKDLHPEVPLLDADSETLKQGNTACCHTHPLPAIPEIGRNIRDSEQASEPNGDRQQTVPRHEIHDGVQIARVRPTRFDKDVFTAWNNKLDYIHALHNASAPHKSPS